MKQGIEELIAAERWSYRGNRLFKGELCLATLTYPNDVLVAVKENNRYLDRIAAALREHATELDRLRDLCAATYQMAGAMNAPVRFLDALSNAAQGEPFDMIHMLPYSPDEGETNMLHADAPGFPVTEQIPLTVEQAQRAIWQWVKMYVAFNPLTMHPHGTDALLAALRMEPAREVKSSGNKIDLRNPVVATVYHDPPEQIPTVASEKFGVTTVNYKPPCGMPCDRWVYKEGNDLCAQCDNCGMLKPSNPSSATHLPVADALVEEMCKADCDECIQNGETAWEGMSEHSKSLWRKGMRAALRVAHPEIVKQRDAVWEKTPEESLKGRIEEILAKHLGYKDTGHLLIQECAAELIAELKAGAR